MGDTNHHVRSSTILLCLESSQRNGGMTLAKTVLESFKSFNVHESHLIQMVVFRVPVHFLV